MDRINITQSTIEYAFIEIPDPNEWILSHCISKDTNGNYRVGLCDVVVSEDEIRERLSANQIAELEKKLQIGKDNVLWLTETGNYYLANREDPMSDQNKRLVGGQLK